MIMSLRVAFKLLRKVVRRWLMGFQLGILSENLGIVQIKEKYTVLSGGWTQVAMVK